MQNFLVLIYTVNQCHLNVCSVAYSCDIALPLKLIYRYFNKTYVLTLHAVLFSLFQCASTIVTYMIVLMQFDQSEYSHNICSRNLTN
jgi:hypothetical protein